jgi:hypothetical protein
VSVCRQSLVTPATPSVYTIRFSPFRVVRMRGLFLLPLALLALTACSESQASRIDYRTYRIEGPPMAGGETGPNRRLANRLCPNGFRVLDESRSREEPQAGVSTLWTIQCI